MADPRGGNPSGRRLFERPQYARPDYSSDTWMILVTEVGSKTVIGRSDSVPMAVHPLQKGFIS